MIDQLACVSLCTNENEKEKNIPKKTSWAKICFFVDFFTNPQKKIRRKRKKKRKQKRKKKMRKEKRKKEERKEGKKEGKKKRMKERRKERKKNKNVTSAEEDNNMFMSPSIQCMNRIKKNYHRCM